MVQLSSVKLVDGFRGCLLLHLAAFPPHLDTSEYYMACHAAY